MNLIAPKSMGLFSVGCKVENHSNPDKLATVSRLYVDTGSAFTWIDERILRRIGIEPQKKDLQIQMANGQIVTRSVGFAILRVGKSFTTNEVVFAQPGDLSLLGCRALEGLNLRVDSRQKKLVATGPIIAATAIRPRFAEPLVVPFPHKKVKAMQPVPKQRAMDRSRSKRKVRK